MTPNLGRDGGWRTATVLAAVPAAIAFFLSTYPALHAAWYGASAFQDDTFYYVVTARNFLRQGTFSFDGVNATNGFQPLWMAAVVALYKLIGSDAALEMQIFAVSALEKTLHGAAVATSLCFFAQALRLRLPWSIGYLAWSAV